MKACKALSLIQLVLLWSGAAFTSRRNNFTFWRERRAGRCEAPRRSRCRTSSRSGNSADTRPSPPRPFGLRPAGLRGAVPAGFVARSSHTAWVLLVARALPAGTAGRSPGGLDRNVKLFLREPLVDGEAVKQPCAARANQILLAAALRRVC